jgi:hypothetical protein
VKMLFGSAEALPRITPTWDKRFLQLNNATHHFEADPVALAAVYFIDPRTDDPSAPAIHEESKRGAMVKLVGNIGANYVLDDVSPQASFDLLQRLARSVPMRRLVPRAGPDYLPQLRELVLADLSAQPASARPSRRGEDGANV